MSADARVWNVDATTWEGRADGLDNHVTGSLPHVLSWLTILTGNEYHWYITEHDNGPALSGYVVPRPERVR